MVWVESQLLLLGFSMTNVYMNRVTFNKNYSMWCWNIHLRKVYSWSTCQKTNKSSFLLQFLYHPPLQWDGLGSAVLAWVYDLLPGVWYTRSELGKHLIQQLRKTMCLRLSQATWMVSFYLLLHSIPNAHYQNHPPTHTPHRLQSPPTKWFYTKTAKCSHIPA